ncbi:YbaK/EbsC family protein [Tenggerimyces flavus]|uniref:YbaK/EbsC family protein n=1 Tax=Tenggerimyces flavus TaxID=1708749 RepID=A0ABV7YNZ7_9ACTN|nr:YbaK/EbsC family protein [Tenggerimyces flavus]MBM7789468.1 prolyl-tRNA editing enzyme YbaK/EbsC (Cys-tRNA(Pro) deacylase) [Tenggerimyces flavus]
MTVAVEAVNRVLAALESHGAKGQLVKLDSPIPTAAAAASALGCEVGAIANSLIFMADESPLLVVASGAHRVDTKLVAALIGVRKVRRATPEQVLSATGQEVGGCAPIGHPHPVQTVLDDTLAKFPVVWAGGGDHFTMFSSTLAELERMTGGKVASVAAAPALS